MKIQVQESAPVIQILPAVHPDGYLRMPQLLRLVPVKAPTIWGWCKKRKFPQPVRLSENCTAWRTSEVLAWLEARRQESQASK